MLKASDLVLCLAGFSVQHSQLISINELLLGELSADRQRIGGMKSGVLLKQGCTHPSDWVFQQCHAPVRSTA